MTMTMTTAAAAGLVVVLLARIIAPRRRARVALDASTAAARTTLRRGDRLPSWARATGRRRRRTDDIEPMAIGAWLDDLSRSVRHGSTLRLSLLQVRPDDDGLDSVCTHLRQTLERGADVADACRTWIERMGALRPDARQRLVTTGSVIGVAATVGGSVGEPLDRLAAAMRQYAADDLERDAQTAQARISARVLTLLPVVVLLLLIVLDGAVRSTVTSPVGATVVGAGSMLNLLGGWWMRQIIGRTPHG